MRFTRLASVSVLGILALCGFGCSGEGSGFSHPGDESASANEVFMGSSDRGESNSRQNSGCTIDVTPAGVEAISLANAGRVPLVPQSPDHKPWKGWAGYDVNRAAYYLRRAREQDSRTQDIVIWRRGEAAPRVIYSMGEATEPVTDDVAFALDNGTGRLYLQVPLSTGRQSLGVGHRLIEYDDASRQVREVCREVFLTGPHTLVSIGTAKVRALAYQPSVTVGVRSVDIASQKVVLKDGKEISCREFLDLIENACPGNVFTIDPRTGHLMRGQRTEAGKLEMTEVTAPLADALQALSFLPDFNGEASPTLRPWVIDIDVTKGVVTRVAALPGDVEFMVAAEEIGFSPDGERVFYYRKNGIRRPSSSMELYDAATGQLMAEREFSFGIHGWWLPVGRSTIVYYVPSRKIPLPERPLRSLDIETGDVKRLSAASDGYVRSLPEWRPAEAVQRR